jgi:hypothetical protein
MAAGTQTTSEPDLREYGKRPHRNYLDRLRR